MKFIAKHLQYLKFNDLLFFSLTHFRMLTLLGTSICWTFLLKSSIIKKRSPFMETFFRSLPVPSGKVLLLRLLIQFVDVKCEASSTEADNQYK